jgi:hypothetical protein
MLWLPLLAAVTSLFALALVTATVAGPLYAAGALHGGDSWTTYLILIPGLIASSFVTIYANVALAFAANEQMDGRNATMAQVLGLAWQKKGSIFAWAITSTIIGLVIRTIEQRMGLLSKVAGLIGGLAWAVATFMAIPVLAFEDITPWTLLARSSHILKSSFGTVARSSVRFGMLFIGWVFLAFAVIVAGVVLLSSSVFLGAVVIAAGIIALAAIGMYSSAASIYLRTVLYRIATGRPVPNLGTDPASLLRYARQDPHRAFLQQSPARL